MIRANLRLVVKIAQDYANYGMPVTDLISEGNIGLMKAVERFDPEKGGKLSTYAAWWIKQSIKRALANHECLMFLVLCGQQCTGIGNRNRGLIRSGGNNLICDCLGSKASYSYPLPMFLSLIKILGCSSSTLGKLARSLAALPLVSSAGSRWPY